MRGHLLLSLKEAAVAKEKYSVPERIIRPLIGSQEFIRGQERRCIWIFNEEAEQLKENPWLASKFEKVGAKRRASGRATTKDLAKVPFRFGEIRQNGDELVRVG